MMIAISAGFVITRVASEEDKSSISSDLVQQFLDDPKPVWITAFAIASLSLIPGTPVLLLFGVSISLGAMAYSLYMKRQRLSREQAEQLAKAGGTLGQDEITPTFAVPLAVVVSKQLTQLV